MFGKRIPLHLCSLAVLAVLPTAGWGASSYFQPLTTYGSAGWRASSVAAADVNGDGKVDLLVANQCGANENCTVENGGFGRGVVSVLLGNGDGTFQSAQPYFSGGYAATTVAVTDFNNDGKADLVVGHSCGSSDCSSPTVVGVLLGKGDGTFLPATTYQTGGYGTAAYWTYGVVSVKVGDFNGDGRADIVAVNELVEKDRFERGDALVGVLLGNGDGTFQPARMYDSGGAIFAVAAAVGDVNNDGKLDLVVGHADGNFKKKSTLGVLLGNGDGTFQAVRTYSSGGFIAHSIALGDVNEDGKVDILVANEGRRVNSTLPGVVWVLLGNGDGTFTTVKRYASSTGVASIFVTDVNRDGKPDFLMKDGEGWNVGVSTYLGYGDGTFQLPGKRGKAATFGNSIVAADLNGDGRPDVAVAQGCGGSNSCTGGVGVLLNAIP